MILILLLMLLLGPTQVIWAFIHMAVTEDLNTKLRFGYYLIGVGLYFAALIPMWNDLAALETDPLFSVHFFGGAWALAIYHIYIVAKAFTKHEPDFTKVDMNGNPI